nr:hypothetical protein [Streptococcus agalactiae]
DAVLTDAFAGGFVVGHRVAGAAVQQSMIPAGRPGGDIMALNEQRSSSAPGAVAGDTGAGCSAADDNDLAIKTSRHLQLLCFRLTPFSHSL